MLKKLKGIEKEKEVREQEESALKRLLALGDELVNDKELGELTLEFIDGSRSYINNKINFDFTKEDFISLLRAKEDYYTNDNSKRIFGFYTGCLATRLYNKNPEIVIHIKDVKLDCLLRGLEKANEVVIENCKGNWILKDAGSNGGRINSIKIKEVTGYDLGEFIGSHGGSVENVLIENCKGHSIGVLIGSEEGNVRNVIIKDCEGFSTGSSIGAWRGNVEKIIVNNSSSFDKKSCNANEIIIDGVRYVH